MYQLTEKKVEKKFRRFTYKNINYAAELVDDKYIVYDATDLETPVGEMASKDGKPALPIKLY
jgi:hypothetical protein